MSNLDPLADEAVRGAVEAFVAGTFVPAFRGETIFETKNSRYRLLDGVVIDAPDESLVGAELVGWLVGSPGGGTVEPAWQTGARAVLVDRRKARNIVVTSTTSLRTEGARGSSPRRPAPAPTEPSPGMSPRRAPILAATPPPGAVQPVPVAASSEPSQPRAAVHPPPRPIAPSRDASYPLPPPPRPLPPPAPPPRRSSPLPVAPPPDEQVVSSAALPLVTRISRPQPIADEDTESEPVAGWEITSAEMEIAVDSEAAVLTGRKVEQHDTLEDIPYEAPGPNDGPDPAHPFLLTRQPPSVPPPDAER